MIELSADNNSDDNRKALQSKILENVSSTKIRLSCRKNLI